MAKNKLFPQIKPLPWTLNVVDFGVCAELTDMEASEGVHVGPTDVGHH